MQKRNLLSTLTSTLSSKAKSFMLLGATASALSLGACTTDHPLEPVSGTGDCDLKGSACYSVPYEPAAPQFRVLDVTRSPIPIPYTKNVPCDPLFNGPRDGQWQVDVEGVEGVEIFIQLQDHCNPTGPTMFGSPTQMSAQAEINVWPGHPEVIGRTVSICYDALGGESPNTQGAFSPGMQSHWRTRVNIQGCQGSFEADLQSDHTDPLAQLLAQDGVNFVFTNLGMRFTEGTDTIYEIPSNALQAADVRYEAYEGFKRVASSALDSISAFEAVELGIPSNIVEAVQPDDTLWIRRTVATTGQAEFEEFQVYDMINAFEAQAGNAEYEYEKTRTYGILPTDNAVAVGVETFQRMIDAPTGSENMIYTPTNSTVFPSPGGSFILGMPNTTTTLDMSIDNSVAWNAHGDRNTAPGALRNAVFPAYASVPGFTLNNRGTNSDGTNGAMDKDGVPLGDIPLITVELPVVYKTDTTLSVDVVTKEEFEAAKTAPVYTPGGN